MIVHRIPSAIGFDSSIYLVISDRTFLVDAGTGLDPNVPYRVERLLDGRALDMVVLTHCHFDHAGGVKSIVEHFDGPAVYAGKQDVPYLASADSRVILNDMFGYPFEPLEAEPLEDGQILVAGESFQVITTPGHTEGSICLYNASEKALFSGDTLFENGYGRTDFPGGSEDSMKASILRLSNIDIRELYPGHGNICDNFSPGLMARVKNMVGV